MAEILTDLLMTQANSDMNLANLRFKYANALTTLTNVGMTLTN